MEDSLFASAIKYVQSGLSVIPVGKDKRPLIEWLPFCDRRASEEEIKEWFKRWPNLSAIGIVTGEISGITVVDVEFGGDFTPYPETTTAITGGGGRHFYFKYSPGVKNAARVKNLVDLRGHHGFVVAPPSVSEKGPYTWVRTDILAPFPTHLFVDQSKDPFSKAPAQKKDWKVLEEGAKEGSRNETAAKVAGKLLRSIHPDEWESVAWPALSGWNQKNSPPLPEDELRDVFKSVGRKAIHDERRPASKETKKEFSQQVEVSKVAWREALELGEAELLATKASDFLSYGYNFLDDVLTGIFPGELVVIGGSTGTGKTTLAMNIIMKAAKAGHRCFCFVLEDRLEEYAMKAIFFKLNQIARRDTENLKDTYSWNLFRRNAYSDDRFKELMIQAKAELANDNIKFIKVSGRMTYEIMEKVIDEEVLDGTEIFLVDHLGYFSLDSSDLGRTNYIDNFMVDLRTMQRRNKARVILLAHYRKLNNSAPTLDSFRDSVSIVQNANVVLNLYREKPGEGEKKKNESITQQISQFRGTGEERYVKTFFLIPKVRSPNGENLLMVDFDRVVGDYVDCQATEFKPLSEMMAKMEVEEPKTQDQMQATINYDWMK